jgi:DNA-binding SARP family transcriptional activator/DNA-binding HxlR family transcriptional regulator
MRGTTSIEAFQQGLFTTSETLAPRLDALVEAQLMELRPRDNDPPLGEYVLTEMGRDLEPAVLALTIWELRWVAPKLLPALFLLEDTREESETQIDEESIPLVVEINLLGTFDVRIGESSITTLSAGSQRLLAFLALQDRTVARIAMAGAMWPESSDEAAGTSLRSALSRLDSPTREALLVASAGLRLSDAVVVDYREAQAIAHRLLQPGANSIETDLSVGATTALSTELLPDWYDDWVVAEAEDWRQLRVSALEAQSGRLIASGRVAEAAGAARAAMRVEPLRESAHSRLIEVHLAEGNQSEALRVFDRYRVLLRNELGLEPTPHLSDLVADIQRQ